MKKFALLFLISPLLATGIISAWSIDKQEWVIVKTDGKKREACYFFSGGVCHKKEDVTGRIYKEKNSSGFSYIIRSKK